MISFFTELHEGHAPRFEYFRGERVPCFESPARARFVRDELVARSHELRAPSHDSAPLLTRIHAPRYLAFLESAFRQWLALDPRNAEVQPFPSVWPVRTLRDDVEPTDFVARLGLYSMDNGTPLAAGTWTAVKAAADAAASAAALVASGARAAFCATRPPGHHAGADFMGGYCFLNHAAVASEALLGNGCERVAILDVDYHHGNGTQSLFYRRSDVLFASLHADPRIEYPFYLGHADETGEGEGEGFNLNLPLPAGTRGPEWLAALEVACTRIAAVHADALVVSLGLDTFARDPLTKFALESSDYPRLGERLARLGLPTVLVLEGGYAAAELGTNAANVLDGFEGAGAAGSRMSRSRPGEARRLSGGRLDLVAATLEHVEAELDSPERLGVLLGASVRPGWPPGEYDRAAMEHFRDRLAADPASAGWYGWYALLPPTGGEAPALVAAGGFLGPPDAEGSVELGYSVVEAFRGRGLATEMVLRLVERAFEDSRVARVTACTTPANVASLRVLERCGFRHSGEGPEPGTIRLERGRGLDVPAPGAGPDAAEPPGPGLPGDGPGHPGGKA